jgi:hypothetical protein
VTRFWILNFGFWIGVFALAACSSDRPVTKHGDRDDNGEIKEHRDEWHPNEAQSDFLDIGKQA